MALSRLALVGSMAAYPAFTPKSSTIVAVSGSIQPHVVIEAELAGVGGGWTNLGMGGFHDVIASAGVTAKRGLHGSGPTDNTAGADTLSFTLNNSASNSAATLGYYSPYHASKLSGWGLGINCRLTLVDPNTLSAWPQFTGRIDAIDPVPGKHGARRVRVTVVGWMDEAARYVITADVAEQVQQTWDQVIAAIIAKMPTPPVAVDLDPGITALPYSLDTAAFTATPALAEFKKLTDSERGLLYIKADGTLKGEGRHARLLMTTSGLTLTEDDITALSLPSTREEIINALRVTVHPRQVVPVPPAAPTAVVYSQANVIEVTGHSSKLLLGSYRDAVTGLPIGATAIQTPLVPGTDYTANALADGSGASMMADISIAVLVGPSGLNMTVSNANAMTAYLTSLQVRGRAVKDQAAYMLQARDAASILANGEHAVEIDMPYQDNADTGQGTADYYLTRYSTAFPQARSVSLTGRTPSLMAAILAGEISDRLTLSESVTGLASDYFINAVDLRVLPSGHLAASYTLAPAADPFAGLYWVLGTGVLGTSTIPSPI